MADDETPLIYPTPDDVFAIHERVIAADPGAPRGVKTPDAVESALVYVSEGYFGEVPETIHEKAAHLMRLLAADHPFVDGNKRTALATTVVFYDLNEWAFEYDHEVRRILRAFGTDAEAVDMERVVVYCRDHTEDTSP